jgi:hypothetical protein
MGIRSIVAKGVHEVDEEYAVDSELSRFQGWLVPVYLDMIDLVQPYWLVSGAVVTRMMLMSWAGQSLRMCKPKSMDVDKEVIKSTAALEGAGLDHDGIRPDNVL